MWFDKLKVIGNILAGLSVAAVAIPGAPAWLLLVGAGCKIAADTVKAVIKGFSGEANA
jgi:hypothetical protein